MESRYTSHLGDNQGYLDNKPEEEDWVENNTKEEEEDTDDEDTIMVTDFEYKGTKYVIETDSGEIYNFETQDEIMEMTTLYDKLIEAFLKSPNGKPYTERFAEVEVTKPEPKSEKKKKKPMSEAQLAALAKGRAARAAKKK